jgi:mono/diheme cytochrome c family protein
MVKTKRGGRNAIEFENAIGSTEEPRWATRSAILAITAIALTCLTAAFAQNEDKVKAGLAAWRSSGCADCHGAFANGEKERDESPTGADLRRARLTMEELRLAIRCGRPGTGMPSFQEGA